MTRHILDRGTNSLAQIMGEIVRQNARDEAARKACEGDEPRFLDLRDGGNLFEYERPSALILWVLACAAIPLAWAGVAGIWALMSWAMP